MTLMVALGIRNLSPDWQRRTTQQWAVQVWLVRGYGSRCEDCVYYGTITLVQYAAYLSLLRTCRKDVVGGGAGYHSIPIILVRRTVLQLHFLEVSPILEQLRAEYY